MKIAIGFDHGGFPLKNDIIKIIKHMGHEILDMGAHENDPEDDFPDFAAPVAKAVQNKTAKKGIIVCGSGVGANIVANKFKGVRAGLCHDTYSAAQGVKHDDMNILCLGARVVGAALAEELVIAFIQAELESNEDRFIRRLNKVKKIENNE
ncbi:MAG: ribose 5-phosphate isomerase B [Chloroflexi bacterium]|nr:ribose 5-phosphate isomerase B [Chloroflexota bacterium]